MESGEPPSPADPAPTLPAHRAAVRAVVGLGVGLAVAVAAASAWSAGRAREDLARDKPWRASSNLAVCTPARLECGGARTAIFFHTALEAQPWVEVDLGGPTTVTSAEVLNRRDGPRDVLDRAVPLVLEASDDQQTWRALAQVDEPFVVWAPTFPAATARYVRARSPRETYLHLEALRLFP